jgi:hypothetical protein
MVVVAVARGINNRAETATLILIHLIGMAPNGQ